MRDVSGSFVGFVSHDDLSGYSLNKVLRSMTHELLLTTSDLRTNQDSKNHTKQNHG